MRSPWRLAALCAAALVSAAAAEAGEPEPDCPEPDLGDRDFLGVAQQRSALPTAFSRGSFATEAGGDVPPVPPAGGPRATRAVLRAPVHTCRIKLLPGLRAWIKQKGPLFGDLVTVQAFSQPPSLIFLTAEGTVAEQVSVLDEATTADVTALLRSRGVVSEESDAADADAAQRDPGAVSRGLEAIQPEPDMAIAMALQAAQAELAAARAELARTQAAAAAANATPSSAASSASASAAAAEAAAAAAAEKDAGGGGGDADLVAEVVADAARAREGGKTEL